MIARLLSLYWISGFLFLPLSFSLGEYGGKPVELLISDFFLVVTLIFFIWKYGLFKINVFLLVYIFFFIYLFFVSSIYYFYYESFSVFFGFFRFFKSTLVVLVGYWLYKTNGYDLYNIFFRFSFFIAVFFLILLFSDIFFNGGSLPGRWGGNFLGMNIFGFPNAAASFYALCVPVFVYGLNSRYLKKYRLNIFLELYKLSIIILIGFFCVMSLSRNAAATFLLGTFFTVFFIERSIYIKLFYLFSFSLLSLIVLPYVVSNEAIMHKFNSLFGEDPLSGRDEIWSVAVDLIQYNPLFGYGFYSFSNWGFDNGTLHNAFLDLLYKFGLIGFAFYFFIIFLVPYVCFKRGKDVKEKPLYFLLLFMVCFSGFSQESLSYSMSQLLIFFMLGVIISKYEKPLR